MEGRRAIRRGDCLKMQASPDSLLFTLGAMAIAFFWVGPQIGYYITQTPSATRPPSDSISRMIILSFLLGTLVFWAMIAYALLLIDYEMIGSTGWIGVAITLIVAVAVPGFLRFVAGLIHEDQLWQYYLRISKGLGP